LLQVPHPWTINERTRLVAACEEKQIRAAEVGGGNSKGTGTVLLRSVNARRPLEPVLAAGKNLPREELPRLRKVARKGLIPMSAKTKTLSTAVVPIAEQGPQLPVSISSLLTPEEVAERLAVSVAWVRSQTRSRAYVREKDPLPCVRLGKFVRFRWTDIELWLERQASTRSVSK
jgi:predicted DNA-binding transcriptional regulator AlpA